MTSFSELEMQIRTVLEIGGPQNGKAIIEALEVEDHLLIWKVCRQSELFRTINCARYYLRYDITRENLLRLSPSVLRDFMSYSLVYLGHQKTDATHRSALLANKHRLISLKKLRVARQAVLSLDPKTQEQLKENACCFIAGDISYFLAHEEPRLHKELETIVHGSDIDILIVHDNDFDPQVVAAAERQMLGFKFRALKDPRVGEEVDFLFKPIRKMLDQFQYSDIHQKIACKILYESFFLFGRLDMYEKLQADLEFSGTKEKIEADFQTALMERQNTINKICDLTVSDNPKLDPEIESLFFFSQERLEFQ